MADQQKSLEERWDLILEIHNDYIEMFDFSKFEDKYGQRLDELRVEANQFAGDFIPEEFERNQKIGLEWYLGQFREICKDKRNANQYMERALSVDRESNTFFFVSKEFLGENLHSLFVQTDTQRKQQVRDFKRNYSVNQGWHDAKLFPGNMIYYDFCWSDRRSYEGAKVALLMRAEKPNEPLQEIVGEITLPYVPLDEDGRIGAIFELELENGERKEYNSNDIKEMKAQEQSETTYHSITSGLKKDGFTLYSGSGLIPAGSDLAVIEGHPDSKSFSVSNYTMTENRNFGAGSLATFDVSRREGQSVQLNINNLNNVLYIRAPTPE